jgi:anti-sigma factor RsiW
MHDGLIDVALGQPPPDDVRAHLRSCAACRAALDRHRATIARADRVLRETVAQQPPAGLVARITAAASAQRARARFGSWVRAGVAAALVAGIAWAMESHALVRTAVPAGSIVSWHSPTQALLQSRESIVDAPFRDSVLAPGLKHSNRS